MLSMPLALQPELIGCVIPGHLGTIFQREAQPRTGVVDILGANGLLLMRVSLPASAAIEWLSACSLSTKYAIHLCLCELIKNSPCLILLLMLP
jgi:hypothetical protein